MKRRRLLTRIAASAASPARPAWAQQRGVVIGQSAAFCRPAARFDSRNHPPSSLVDLSMLPADGSVRR